jgi:hypothetical protein
MVRRAFHHVGNANGPRAAMPSDPADNVSLAPWLTERESSIPKNPDIPLRTDWFEYLKIGEDLFVGCSIWDLRVETLRCEHEVVKPLNLVLVSLRWRVHGRNPRYINAGRSRGLIHDLKVLLIPSSGRR